MGQAASDNWYPVGCPKTDIECRGYAVVCSFSPGMLTAYRICYIPLRLALDAADF